MEESLLLIPDDEGDDGGCTNCDVDVDVDVNADVDVDGYRDGVVWLDEDPLTLTVLLHWLMFCRIWVE